MLCGGCRELLSFELLALQPRGAQELLCESIFAHSTALVGRRPREGSEGPPWEGVGLPPGRLGHRRSARG
eukprot:3383507-Alexandrium_andersonii.AAC.1